MITLASERVKLTQREVINLLGELHMFNAEFMVFATTTRKGLDRLAFRHWILFTVLGLAK